MQPRALGEPLEDCGSSNEDGRAVAENRRLGFLANLVQPLLQERRVEEVEAVEHEVAQLPTEGPSDFADLQDLPEDPPQEPASDGLEFEGSESEDPQRRSKLKLRCEFSLLLS